MIGAWIAGGAAALLGAFIYADLSRRRPFAGGKYVYLREAYHPALGFIYGWALLLVIQTGGMAVCAMTFGRYFRQLAGHRGRRRRPAGARPLAVITMSLQMASRACGESL